LKIRKAVEGDSNTIIELEKKTLYPGISTKELKQWIEGEGFFESKIFVTEENGAIIALASYEVYEVNGNEIVLTLDALAVAESSQNLGIGEKMLIHSFDLAKTDFENSGRFKVIGLLIETDVSAVGFYKKVLPIERTQRRDFFDVWNSGEPMVIFFVKTTALLL